MSNYYSGFIRFSMNDIISFIIILYQSIFCTICTFKAVTSYKKLKVTLEKLTFLLELLVFTLGTVTIHFK